MTVLERTYTTINLHALLASLPLLAMVQYRMLGQVSEGERERKKGVLTTMATQFCRQCCSTRPTRMRRRRAIAPSAAAPRCSRSSRSASSSLTKSEL